MSLLIPALLAAARGDAQQKKEVLPSECYPFDKLPLKTNTTTHNETRQVFDGMTHEGFPIDLHITTLAVGQAPHPPHHHVHEEVIFVQTGTLEVMIKGKSTQIGPGSVAYVNSMDEHGWKNVGDTPSQYFVLAIGHKSAG
jgi:mannose-6-phosphate isomerase-like protein (cupin superfamily)